ncbi:hypothetical protein [Leucobacter sp. USHLN154]|uniref:hypothetical protein n=1 Tax=Leucobacter sp. USHLN154 TaxID=3081269 RepID=UPI003015A58A
MIATHTKDITPGIRGRMILILLGAALSAVLIAVAVAGATSALWRTELSTHAALPDAAVLFDVNGESSSASDPTVTYAIGSDDMQALMDDGSIAIPIEVKSLSQGNRGLRYTVTPPATTETDIMHWADTTVFPVTSEGSCTVDTDVPTDPPLTSTPVPATYSDTTTPTTEYWCLHAKLGHLPDAGRYTSTATITGTHALGEIVKESLWDLEVTTAFTVADEPEHEVAFTYETFRAGAEQ